MSKYAKYTAVLLLTTLLVPVAMASVSGDTSPPTFTHRNGYWYDTFGLTRDNAEGNDGYIPGLFSETIGANAERAYNIGVNFRNDYTDSNSRADAILNYVQHWTVYGYDEDNVAMGGKAQPEWAWNADEMVHSIDVDRGIAATGDCEDLAFLCETIYYGAGYETAIIDAPGHVAVLIWLPDYPNANVYWDLSGDNKDAGWIWVEATGSENPVGWTPSDFFNGDWSAYVYSGNNYFRYEPQQTSVDSGGGLTIDWDLIYAILFILFIILSRLFRR
jgi:hypothetical protein